MLDRLSIHAFIEKHQIKNENGKRIDFREHYFLFDIYRDFSPKLCIIKAAQIGATTAEIIKSIWGVKNKKIDSVYILPTDTDVNSMVNSKVNRIIAQNPILQQWTKDKDSVEQKQIGTNYIHYRGSWTQKAAIMVTSDWNCYQKGTEVLTKRGWKKVEDITTKDKVATYENGNIKFYCPDLTIIKWSEKLHNYKSSYFDLSVTPNHKIFFNKNGWKTNTSESIKNGGVFYLGIADTKLRKNSDENIFISEKILKRVQGSSLLNKKEFKYRRVYQAKFFYDLIGWYLSEGNVSKHKDRLTGRINISQKNTKHLKKIEYMLNGLDVKWCYSSGTFSFTDWALAIYLERLGNSHNKYIPEELLYQPKYLPILLRSLYDGDCFYNKHTEYLNTASRRLANDVQIAWLFLGKMSSITEVEDRTCRMYRVGVRKHQKVQFNVYKNREKSGRIIEKESNDFVYCITVKNHLIYVRDNKSKLPIICGQCYDEVDACKQDVVEQYSTRLQHSKLKWEHFFSHPSSVGTGIDKYWQKSDQKHWFIKCSCGKEQYMEWPKSFDIDRGIYVCKYCGKELTDEQRRVGRWVAKYKNREYSGYWIPLFIAPWVSAKEIIAYNKEKSEEYFYNKVLGLPYVGGGNKLTKAHLMQNLTGNELITPENKDRIVIGIDTGKHLHLVMGGEAGLFYYETIIPTEDNEHDPWIEVYAYMERWPRAVAIVDQGGDLIGTRKFREKYPGRVFLCSFGTDRKTKELARWGKNDEDGAVIADRNRSIQLVVDEYTDGRIAIQGEENDWYDYWLHWNALTRIKEIDDKTGEVKRRIWVRNADDHWALATVYWRIGMSRFSSVENQIIGEKEEVEEAPVIYPGDVMDSTWANKPYKKKKDDWRKNG